MKKSSLLAILAMCSFMCLSGCDASAGDPIFNVAYEFDKQDRKFKVYVPKDGFNYPSEYEKMEEVCDVYKVPLNNYHYIPMREWFTVEIKDGSFYGSGRTIYVQNEFYKNTSTLYVYGIKN